MSSRITDSELNELVMAHLGGNETEEQATQLEALLAFDRENVERYIRYVNESALLSRALASEKRPPTSRSVSPSHAGAGPLLKPRGRSTDRQGVGRRSITTAHATKSPRLWWCMAAAAVVLMAASLWAPQAWRPSPDQNPADSSNDQLIAAAVADRDPEIVAKIVRKVDCVWEDEKWNVALSQSLRLGQMLRISSGMMEIEFDCGARVALQGPARFTVAGTEKGLFHSGRLTAFVPERARGFSIKAPTTNIVDLGTSFSLNVRLDGSTEVYVNDGEVLSQPMDRVGIAKGKETKLFKWDAILVGLDGERPIAFEKSPQFFSSADESGTAPKEWDLSLANNLVLWLAADYDVEKDSRGRVQRWGDRPYGANSRLEMAWQIAPGNRPLWVPDAMAGSPALRFDGRSSFMVTDSLSTTDEQTAMFVVAVRPWTVPAEFHHVSRQVLNYNGPPNLALQFTDENCFSCWNYSPTEANMLEHDGEFMSPPLPADEPLLICYTYSLSGRYASLMINGADQGRVPITAPARIDSPKYIGSHWAGVQHLDGDLAELLIFNEVLSTEASREVQGYLAAKYRIPVDPARE